MLPTKLMQTCCTASASGTCDSARSQPQKILCLLKQETALADAGKCTASRKENTVAIQMFELDQIHSQIFLPKFSSAEQHPAILHDLSAQTKVTASHNDGGSAVVGLLQPILTEAACNDASPVLLLVCRDCVQAAAGKQVTAPEIWNEAAWQPAFAKLVQKWCTVLSWSIKTWLPCMKLSSALLPLICGKAVFGAYVVFAAHFPLPCFQVVVCLCCSSM